MIHKIGRLSFEYIAKNFSAKNIKSALHAIKTCQEKFVSMRSKPLTSRTINLLVLGSLGIALVKKFFFSNKQKNTTKKETSPHTPENSDNVEKPQKTREAQTKERAFLRKQVVAENKACRDAFILSNAEEDSQLFENALLRCIEPPSDTADIERKPTPENHQNEIASQFNELLETFSRPG